MVATIQDVADKAFDYIICGGGTAGLTLAARLTEDSTVSVLVLEAGQSNIDDPAIMRPAQYGSHFGNRSYSWDHQTVKQRSTGGSSFLWSRGKGLGGSSGINFMCYTKPPAQEIDGDVDFERLGNPGWNWKNFEKYIARTEGFVPPTAEVREKNMLELDTWNMGRDGPLSISFPATIDPAEVKIRETFLNAGFPLAAKPMNGQVEGFYFAPNTYDHRTHTRSYATTAFYLPNKHRPNLSVLVSAHVNRVIPKNGSDPTFHADSVEFEHSGQVYVVRANKEVILSAGALKSPQLLELSGIGSPSVLRSLGIPTAVSLPGVGSNVQEHTLLAISWELRDDVKFDTLDLLRDPAFAAKNADMHASGTGMFTTGIIGFAFVPVGRISDKADEIYRSAHEKITKNAESYPPGLLEQYKIQLERLKDGAGCEFISFPGMASRPNPPDEGKRYFSLYVAMNHCFSRGTIHATSKDPAVEPEFDPRYFDEEVDLQVWLEMIKFARKLSDVAPLKDMIVKELNPGPQVQTDAQIIEWMKTYMSTTWHTAGSCSMLPKVNGGVVDPSLKVYGTSNLRVVDLSVAPLHFAAHPQAMVYGIAEQAADIIKGECPSV